MNREHAELAIERVRRTWPTDEARALTELRGAELELVLGLALYFDATPVDGETLLPIAGDPLRPRPLRAPAPRRRGRPRPPELLAIARRLELDVGDLRDGEVEPLTLDLEAASS